MIPFFVAQWKTLIAAAIAALASVYLLYCPLPRPFQIAAFILILALTAWAAFDAYQTDRTIKANIGNWWEPLTPQQVDDLAKEVGTLEKRRISIMYENAQGKELASSIAEAFVKGVLFAQ